MKHPQSAAERGAFSPAAAAALAFVALCSLQNAHAQSANTLNSPNTNSPITASNSSESSLNLDAVVVSAARSSQLLRDTLAHTSVISRAQIAQAGAADLPSLLATLAGVQFTQSGGRGMVSSLFVRGLDSAQTLVLWDGVPLNKQSAAGGVSLEHISLEAIERIEVVRGNVSALYGSNAVGGVVQIFTRAAKTGANDTWRVSPSASLEAGSAGSRSAAATVAAANAHTQIALTAQRFRTDGINATNAGFENPTWGVFSHPDRDGSDHTTVSLNARQKLGSQGRVGLVLRQTSANLQFDGGTNTYNDTGRNKERNAAAFAEYTLSPAWQTKLELGRALLKSHTQADYGGGAEQADTDTQSKTLRWSNQFALGTGLKAQAGAEQNRYAMLDRTSNPWATNPSTDVSRTDRAAFAGLNYQSADYSAQFNLRRDQIAQANAQSAGQKAVGKTTYQAAYGYQLTSALKATASMGTSFVAPRLGQMYGSVWNAANLNLLPESAKSRELGLQYAAGAHSLRLAAFDTRVDNKIAYFSDPATFVGTYKNIAKARSKGVELAYQGSLKLWRNPTLFNASLTYQEPKDATTGKLELKRARVLANLGAAHTVRWGAARSATLGLQLRHVGASTDYGNQALPAYTLADVSAHYALTQGMTAYAKIHNATDKRYQSTYGYNAAGRQFALGVSGTF